MAKTISTDKKQAPQVLNNNVTTFTIAGRKISFTQEEKVCSALLLLLIFLVYTIRSKFSMMPFERDEGIYSYFGTLVLDGKIPYKDFYEVKFPGLFYFYGLMTYLFGDTLKGMHTGFNYLNILTLILVYQASKNLFSPIAGLISAITYAFVSITPNLSGFTVQAEQGVAFFIALGVFFYSLAKKHKAWYYYCLMGLSMGCAFMVKTSGVFLALWGGFMVIIDFLFTKPKKIKMLIVDLVSYSVGGFAIIIILFLIIYSLGAFNDMIFWAYELPKKYVGSVPFEEGMKYFKYTRDAIVQNYKFFWVHSLLAVIVCLVPSVNYALKFFGVSLLAFSFMTIVPGYYFYGHYWIQAIPGLAIVAGLTYHSVMSLFENTFNLKKPAIKYVYLAVFCLLTFNHINSQKSYYFHPYYEGILRAVYGNNPFPEAMEIGNYINTHSKPEDKVVLIGSEPQIYFYTQKRCPSRFAYFTALVNDIPQHKAWQREFVQDVEKAKPRYFVFFNHPISLLVQPNVDQYVFEWANKYITDNYKAIGIIDMIEGQQSTYVWNENVNTYRPQGKNIIYIFERKDALASATAPAAAATATTTSTSTAQ